MKRPFSHFVLHAIGDCTCGHSIMYHAPLMGCIKCDCDEYR